MGEVLEFMRLLWALDHGLQSTSKRMVTRFGITGPQRLVIRIVGHYPGISAGEVSDILHLHPSTLTGVLRRLEREGALKRTLDPEDHRRWHLYLTPKGRTFDRLQSGTVESGVKRALGRISKAKLKVAQEILSVLSREMNRES